MNNKNQELCNLDFINDIHTPESWKKLLYQNAKAGRSRKMALLKLSPAAVVLVLVLCFSTITVGAYSFGGLELFKNIIKSDSVTKLGAYNHVDDFNELASDQKGNVISDDKVEIQLVSSVCDGNSAIVLLKFTIKDSDVLDEMGFAEKMNQYDFTFNHGGPAGSLLSKDGSNVSCHCISPGKDNDLEQNQFKAYYKVYARKFTDQTEETIQYGDYTVPVKIMVDDQTKLISIGKTLSVDNYNFLVSSAQISQMSLRVNFTGDFANKQDSNRDESLIEIVKKARIIMKDGNEMNRKTYDAGISPTNADLNGYSLNVSFHAPVNTSEIHSVIINDIEYTLDK